MKTIYKRVLSIMDSPECRNSDRKVVWEYWQRYDGLGRFVDRHAFLYDLTDPGSITRACRKVREECPHLGGDAPVERERMEREKFNKEFWKQKIQSTLKEDK